MARILDEETGEYRTKYYYDDRGECWDYAWEKKAANEKYEVEEYNEMLYKQAMRLTEEEYYSQCYCEDYDHAEEIQLSHNNFDYE